MTIRFSDLPVEGDRAATDEIVLRRAGTPRRISIASLLSGLATAASLLALTLRVAALEGGGGGGQSGDLTVRMGTSVDAVPAGSELTIEAVAGVGVVPAYAGDMHLLIGRLEDEPDISAVRFSDDQSNTNQIGAFTKAAATVHRGGDDFNVWVSNQLLTQTQAVTVMVS